LEDRAQDRENAAKQEHVVQERQQCTAAELETRAPAALHLAEAEGQVEQNQRRGRDDRQGRRPDGLTSYRCSDLVVAAVRLVDGAHPLLQVGLEAVPCGRRHLRRPDDECAVAGLLDETVDSLLGDRCLYLLLRGPLLEGEEELVATREVDPEPESVG